MGAQTQQEVAFSAGLTKHEYLAANQIVVYRTIFTNIGGGYDSNTGKFKCPVSGLYVFQFHALSHSGSNMWLELHHNDRCHRSLRPTHRNLWNFLRLPHLLSVRGIINRWLDMRLRGPSSRTSQERPPNHCTNYNQQF